MGRKRKAVARAAGALAGVSALAAGVSYLTTRFFVRAALDRKKPKAMEATHRRASGSKGNDEFRHFRAAAAQRLLEEETQPVFLTAQDGVRLAGHWYPCENPERVVIAVHGWRTTWNRDFGMMADFLHESGCDVLFIEQRGQNDSGGDYMGFGVTEQFDCQDWAQWVIRCKSDSLPIYLYGVSMGGATVCMAAGLLLPETVHGIIGDCGFTSPDAIWKHVAEDNFHVPYGINRRMAGHLYQKRNQINPFHYSAVEALGRTQIPVLLIHGEEDRFVPVEMARENFEACASPKRLLIVPGAGHAMSYYTDPEGYETALRNFWKDFDGETGTSSVPEGSEEP